MRKKLLVAMIALMVVTLGMAMLITRHATQVVLAIPDGPPGELPPLPELQSHWVALFALAGGVALVLTIVVAWWIARPIERLTAAVKHREALPVDGTDELARLAAAFNAQEDLRRRMVGDVAHELRTPLTNLRCELEAIQDELAVADAPRIASLHESTLHLQRLVEDLQDLALADAGVLTLHKEAIDVGDAIIVDADPTRLRQIMTNLVANAEAVATKVTITQRVVDGFAEISIADNGPGIPPGELDRVFERFYRVDPARSAKGAGLGLSIVRRLVELHGGRVWAESNHGTTIRFTLPLHATFTRAH